MAKRYREGDIEEFMQQSSGTLEGFFFFFWRLYTSFIERYILRGKIRMYNQDVQGVLKVSLHWKQARSQEVREPKRATLGS